MKHRVYTVQQVAAISCNRIFLLHRVFFSK